MRLLFLILVYHYAFLALGAGLQAKGYVYEDRNGNGKKDRGEKGIAQVAVSNGMEVVLTDMEGFYSLPVGDDNIVFVVKPSGYRVTVDERNLPRFYYIHKPKGSPALKYKGVPPTGPLPDRIDFGLIPEPPADDFKIVVLGDPQPYSEVYVDYFARGVVSELEGIKDASFGFSLGDMAGGDHLDLFRPYTEAVKKVGIPWYHVMGNHDMNMDVEADSLTDETFEAHFGPANYAFNQGKVHFIVLDNILYPDPRDGQGYWCGLRKDQLDFVENDLKFVPRDHLVVLVFHSPLNGGGDSFREEDRARLFRLLKDFPHTLTLSAHTHIQRQNFYTGEDGWLREKPHHEYNVGTTSGGWYTGELDSQGIPVATMMDGTPKGYAFLTFKGNQYIIDYKVAGKPRDYQIALFLPKVIPFGKSSHSNVYANFFMGHKDCKVEYRADGGKWMPMRYSEEADPLYLDLLHRWDFAETLMPGRRPFDAIGCTHLWRAKFPSGLPAGRHTIEVKATDMFGRDYYQYGDFRVEVQP